MRGTSPVTLWCNEQEGLRSEVLDVVFHQTDAMVDGEIQSVSRKRTKGVAPQQHVTSHPQFPG